MKLSEIPLTSFFLDAMRLSGATYQRKALMISQALNLQFCPKCGLDAYQSFELHRLEWFFGDWLRLRQIRVPLSVAGVEATVLGPVGINSTVDIRRNHGAIEMVGAVDVS